MLCRLLAARQPHVLGAGQHFDWRGLAAGICRYVRLTKNFQGPAATCFVNGR